jgi:spermidine/putrescine transport system ATP-binding protein
MIVLYNGRIVQSGAPREVLDQPATPEVARLLSVSNLLRAEITALDPGRNTSRLRVLDHDLHGPYFPGHLLGDRVWLCIRPDQLRALPQNGSRPEVNQVSAALVRVSEKAQAVRLEFEGELAVEMPREQYQRQKDNREWRIEFPPDALRLL